MQRCTDRGSQSLNAGFDGTAQAPILQSIETVEEFGMVAGLNVRVSPPPFRLATPIAMSLSRETGHHGCGQMKQIPGQPGVIVRRESMFFQVSAEIAGGV